MLAAGDPGVSVAIDAAAAVRFRFARFTAGFT
jgi:hypothetical protein